MPSLVIRGGKTRSSPLMDSSNPGRRGRLGRSGGMRRVSAARRRARGGDPEQRVLSSLDIPYASQQPLLDRELDGDCRPGACGEEAACKRIRGGEAHVCLCPHDSSPPTLDLKCPNRLTVPLTPKPIHNIIPPSGGNLSVPVLGIQPTSRLSPTFVNDTTPVRGGTMDPFNTDGPGGENLSTDVAGGGYALFGGVAVAALTVIILTTVCYISRRTIADAVCRQRKHPPMPQAGEPLLADRYITNPQYIPQGAANPSTATARQMPLLSNVSPVPTLERDALSFIEEIGEGCFGKVFKGTMRRGNGTIIVAVKVLKESAGRSAEEDFIREVSVMSSFRHPNILDLMGVVLSVDRSLSPWMVFEFMPYGDLAGVLRAGSMGGGTRGLRPPFLDARPSLPVLDENALLYIALQVAQGMQYLATRRFVHRDLACRNCLVGEALCVKIADFGMSRDVYTCDYYKMGGERPMPVRWMSPESIVYARFTLESDVWSYGVLLWEIYSGGKQPFYGHNNDGAAKLILQGIMLVPPEDCPRAVCELMRSCWRSDPRDRATFHDVVRALQTAATAPRPPHPPAALPPLAPLLDAEGYLLPATPEAPLYLDALPDPQPETTTMDASDEEPG